MPSLRAPNKHVVIDYIGSLLIVLATLPLLLGFSWAGDKFSWLSWQSLGLFGSSLVLLVLLVIYSVRQERLGREPVVEPSMFKNVRIFSVSLLASMLISIVLLGSVYFLPVFLQSVIGVSATNSGLALASIAGAVLGGQLISALGRYKWIALTGPATMIAGLLLLLRLDIHSTSLDVVITLLVLGPGVGAGLSLYTITVQNAMPGRIGQATSAAAFFRQLGQSIGLAAIGAVVTTSYVPAFYKALPTELRQTMPPQLIKIFENPLVLTSPTIMTPIRAGFERYGPRGQAAFNAVLNAVKLGLTESIHNAILLSLGLMIVTFFVVCFLKEVPLRSHKEE